jgi:hypothetical protein
MWDDAIALGSTLRGREKTASISFIVAPRSWHLCLKWTDGMYWAFSIASRAHFFASFAVLGPGIFVVLYYKTTVDIQARFPSAASPLRSLQRLQ